MGLCDEFKHTRGRWDISKYPTPSGHNYGIYPWENVGSDVALVRDSYDIQTNEANAVLIAAAPDMLAALCDWYDAMNEGFDSVRGRALYAATEKTIGKAQYGYDIDKNNIRQTLLSGSGKRIFKDKE